MEIIHAVPKSQSRLSRLLTTDFCPWANRFVYWLKEPIGWFVLATLASLLVGAFLSPLGWALAAGLTAVLVLGMGFPWLATHGIRCKLEPSCDELYERESSCLQLSVRNYLPLPVMGLLIEGYLAESLSECDAGEMACTPEAALERVPALSIATYRLPISTEYRGRYPKQSPRIMCAFPFGIWTSKRNIRDVSPVTVLPLLIPITEELELTGDQLSDLGVGNRAATHGDFLGVRDYRRGDSLKGIHWVQSARQNHLVVCERGGPQNQVVAIHLSTDRSPGTNAENRENLAWRVRICASLVALLSARRLPYRLIVDGKQGRAAEGGAGKMPVLHQLAQIPLDGRLARRDDASQKSAPGEFRSQIRKGVCWIAIGQPDSSAREYPCQSAQPAAFVNVEMGMQSIGLRQQKNRSSRINLDDDIAAQLNHWLSEAVHA